jgi:Lrp/AsnC family transcriptional regulator, leucine-responsive regulatory protein
LPNNQRRTRSAAFDSEDKTLDDVNLAILAELQANPRMPMAELGRQIGMSAPATAERVQRLERAGIIAGYQLDIDPAAVGLPVTAFARIRPMPGSLPKIAELAAKTPQVTECYRITGDDCFLLKLHTPHDRRPGIRPRPLPGLRQHHYLDRRLHPGAQAPATAPRRRCLNNRHDGPADVRR